MTVLVSVKINDGVVMAADSASSFESGMVYRHADKIVNLRQGLPIGAMVTGAGGIGNESIDTLLKDLRRRFNGEDEARRDWALDPARYTLAEVANRLRTFLFEEKTAAYAGEVWTRVRLCGYSGGPAACRGLGDSAAWVGLTSVHPGARRTGFRHPVGRGVRGAKSSDLWAWDRL